MLMLIVSESLIMTKKIGGSHGTGCKTSGMWESQQASPKHRKQMLLIIIEKDGDDDDDDDDDDDIEDDDL